MRMHRLLATSAAIGVALSSTALAQTPRARVPARPLACRITCVHGAAPTAAAATADGAWAVQVEWTGAPWATGHVIERARAAGGPWTAVGSDTFPGPLLAAQRAADLAAAKAAAAAANPAPATKSGIASKSGLATKSGISRTATLTPAAARKMALQRAEIFKLLPMTFRDSTTLPRTQYWYRVVAQYADSLETVSAPAAPVTTDSAQITGLAAGSDDAAGTRVIVVWDAPPQKPGYYSVTRNGVPIGTMIVNWSPTTTLFYDNVAISAASRPTYRVTAFFSDGNPNVGISGTITATPPASSVAWCRHPGTR